MSRFRNVLTTTAILAGSSAALLTGGIAKADPAPPPLPVPSVPGLSLLQGLPAQAPQLLQAASQMLLSGTPAAAPAAPVAPEPLASATLNMPQQPAALPGAAPATTALPGITNPLSAPGTAALPGILPASAPVATTPPANGIIPTGEVSLPQVPGLPIPLPQQISFPGDIAGDLASLMPGAAGGAIPQPGINPAAAATSPMPSVGTLFPTAALP